MTNIELLAEDILRMKHRDKIMAALPLFLPESKRADRAEEERRGGMTSVEALTERLNACKHRREIFNALMALAEEYSRASAASAEEEQTV